MEFHYKDQKLLYHGKRFDLISVAEKKEVVIHPGACVILPFLSEEKILLIKNKRVSVSRTLWELPAGTLEKNEPPAECALRELQEECGYKAKTVKPLLHFFTTPGFCNEVIYAFSAHNLEYVGQKLDETEEIEVVEILFQEALEMIRKGEIIDAKTLSTLLFYDKFFR